MFAKLLNMRHWHSWDPHPWKHPWLTRANLSRMRTYSRDVLARERAVLERTDPKKLRIGFCGNIANAGYFRGLPLRKAGYDVSIYLHPHDDFVMSQPAWEEYDGTVPEGVLTLDALHKAGGALPRVEKVFMLPLVEDWKAEYSRSGSRFLRPRDLKEHQSYLFYMQTLIAMQEMDVLWGTQVPYLAYLANRPYVASQMGGELWFEAARNDQLGAIMRKSFKHARLILASNPWTFAAARRFGLTQTIYLPIMIDQEVYSPGPGKDRAEWEAKTGGRFFVLTSSRMDERTKGFSIGIEGFAAFSRECPEARLVLFDWGNDRGHFERKLSEIGLQDRVLRLPPAGKGRVRDALRCCDAVIDQFVVGYYGGGGFEAMACGLPVIGRYELGQYDALCETGAPPVLNANAAADVTNHLRRLYADASLRREIGARTRQWFVDNHGSERRRDDYLAVLAATALSTPLDLRDTPLHERLGRDERAYQMRCWINAPTYPNYGY